MAKSGFSQFDKGPGRKRRRPEQLKQKQLDSGALSELIIGQPYTVSTGEDGSQEKRNYIYIGNAANILNEQDSDDYQSKAFATLDVLIRPISKQGRGNLPRYFSLDNATGCDLHAPSLAQPPIHYSGEQYSNPITITETDPYQSGHDFEVVGRELSDDPSGHISFTIEELNGLNPYTEDISTIAFKGPMVMIGPGYDINGKPIPNEADNEEDASSGIFTQSCLTDNFLEGYLKKSHTHPVGIIDLRFDRKRGMWVSPPPYKLIKAKLIETLAPYQTASAYQITGEYLFDESGYSIPFDNRNSIVVEDFIGMTIESGANVILYYDTDECVYIPLSYATGDNIEEDTGNPETGDYGGGASANNCSGYCIFEWANTGNGGEWHLVENTCEWIGTTTTTTTTTEEPTGSEYGPEIICIDEEDPQTTSTTSTTTPEPTGCNCLYPTYCGQYDGETTRTICYPTGYENTDPYCPTGTTTPCPTGEETGSTTPDPDCVECIWWFADGLSFLVESRCDGNIGASCYYGLDCDETCCYCSLDPPEPPDSECGFISVDCEYITRSCPDPYCDGTCYWVGFVYEDQSGWLYGGGGCYYYQMNCQCFYPSYPPVHGICEYTTTPCLNDTPTTEDPCVTPEPCEEYCHFLSLIEGYWAKVDDPCLPECPCAAPEYQPIASGESAEVQCGTGRTTTTTTTTTTTDEPEQCACCGVPADGCTSNMVVSDCERYGGVCRDACADCYPTVGACCTPAGTCFISSEENCISPNEWLGITGYNACSGDPCELGACCNGAVCTYVRSDQCGGTWYEDEDCDTVGVCTSTTTTTTTTEEPTGSCCYGIEGQLCIDGLTVAECDNIFGQWHTAGCSSDPCTDIDCGYCTYGAAGNFISENCVPPCGDVCPSHIPGNGSTQNVPCSIT